MHTDNNLIYYDNRTLAERFPETDKRWKGIKFGGIEGIKSILKGNINIRVYNPHILNKNLISCDAFGNIKKVQGLVTNDSDHYYFYIDHYWTKSTEEFVNKILMGDVAAGFNKTYMMKNIRKYFKLCDLTIEKINYIEKRTKFNLSEFRVTLKKNSKQNNISLLKRI